MAHIDRASLEAMLAAMWDSFPSFRRYFRAKASKLGKERLAWWDLFAPVGAANQVFSWSQARGVHTGELRHLRSRAPGARSPRLRRPLDRRPDAIAARSAAPSAWTFPASRSRASCATSTAPSIRCFTVAHELGHAFHNECAFACREDRASARYADDPGRDRLHPVRDHREPRRCSPPSRTPAKSSPCWRRSLCGSAQVIVDIDSRYLFEKEVFERRARAEPCPPTTCATS